MSIEIKFKGKIYPSLKALYNDNPDIGVSYSKLYSNYKKGLRIESLEETIVTQQFIEFNDKKYGNLTELFKDINPENISYNSFYRRVKQGMSVEKALTPDFIEFQGSQYKSLSELFNSINPDNLSFNTFYQRLKTGLSIEEALGSAANKRFKGKPFYYKGTQYVTLRELHKNCVENGISYQGFYQRLCGGWTIDDALTSSTSDVIRRDYIVDDKVYSTLMELASDAGISYEAAIKRRDRGFSDYEIFYGKAKKAKPEAQPKEKEVRVIVDGNSFESFAKAYEFFQPSISFNSFRGRLRYGWSVEEALELVAKDDGRTKDKVYLPIGVNSYSLIEASKKFGVPASTIRSRLTRGATPEQAVGLAVINDGDLITVRESTKNAKKKRKVNLNYNGKQYDSIASLARDCGVDQALLYNRIYSNKWSIEKAINTPTNEPVIVGGRQFSSALNAWEEIGKVSFGAYQGRRTLGFALEVCLGIEPLPSSIELNGKNYNSLKEVGKEYGVSYIQLLARLKTMPLSEAVIYKPITGRYNLSAFEKDTQLANTNGYLYFITVETKEGVLHKVGITKRNLDSRFANISNYSVVAIIEGTLSNVYNLEQNILSLYTDNAYKAHKSFEGRTETLILTEEEEKDLLDILEDEVSNNPALEFIDLATYTENCRSLR